MMRKEDTSVVGIRPRKQDEGQDSSGATDAVQNLH